MPKLVLSINDDADQETAGSAGVLNNTTEILGTSTNESEYIGFRITNVTIPQGATINHAAFKVYMASFSTTSETWTLKGENADNSAVFSTATNDISGRTLTTANISNTTNPIND